MKNAAEMTGPSFDPPSLRYGRAGNATLAEFQWSGLSSKSGDDIELNSTAATPSRSSEKSPA